MRQVIIIASLTGSLLIFALTINLFDVLFMFVLFGILPGEGDRLSANQMLTIYAGAAAAIACYASYGRILSFITFIRTRRTTNRTNPA